MSKIETLYIEVCVFKKYKNKISYLVLKRSNNNKIFPGIHQIVTGTIKKNNRTKKSENSIQAAIREVFEETGLLPVRFWILPVVNSYYVQHLDKINISPIFAAEVAHNSKVKISKEHQSYKWLTYRKAVKELIWQNHKTALKYLNDFLTGKAKWGKFLEVDI